MTDGMRAALRASVIAGVLWVAGGDTPAAATPIAEFVYLETDVGNGFFRYEYSVFNLSDPVADFGVNLLGVFLSFDRAQSGAIRALPAGWDAIAGVGFFDLFSVGIGVPPQGSDVPPGGSLSGFVFEFDYKAGNLPFEALLTNPTDPRTPIQAPGTTTPVPEPSSLVLLASGLAALSARSRTRVRSRRVVR